MLIRSGLLLSLMAVFLQIAVFLQPLLPKAYQVAPVCETITRALLLPVDHSAHGHAHSEHLYSQHQPVISDDGHNHHDANHQCQYCTVYANLILPPDLEIQQVLDRIHVRLIAYQKTFKHVWFVLQQLFLIPQGRAPPLPA
ncbi:DUF2946 family protein [Acinetobacter indicus]|uniref:DUF2946 family protein n=1 Tax=Acinetobacter indicus TaxID=756892 RepID=UPI000CEBC5C8|nr:DUF2946 family protein [Acinetobacter indicus]